MTSNDQLELRLPAPSATGDTPLVPARMVNEFVYCPRPAYLVWGQGEWADTADTVSGRRVHARVDRPNAPLPSPETLIEEDEGDKVVSRALTLSSERLGVIAKVDIVEAEGGVVTPIDYKRGKRPHVERGAYEPERVQVCLQALLLEEHGYRVDEGAIWYAESRERVRVVLDHELRENTKDAVSRLRLTVANSRIPPPLRDSPKCHRCALVTICMPDEVRSLLGSDMAPRPIAVGQDEALPLVVQSHRADIHKDGETLKIVEEGEEDKRVRIIDVSDVVLFGNISITTPALTWMMEREIPVSFHSYGGWFRGVAHGIGHRNVEIRTAQYQSSFDDAFCLQFARGLVAAKIKNQRTILRRNWRGDKAGKADVLQRLKASRNAAKRASSTTRLLGLEGDAAPTYFRSFSELLSPPEAGGDDSGARGLGAFRFENRNRRPPTDPVNAMLSLAYAMLSRHLTVSLASIGFDPYRGFYHAPRYGRPAPALDLMEPFRPIIADSVVLSAVNTGEVTESDFVVSAAGTQLTGTGRRRFVAAFERRLSQEATHELFGYRLGMRRLPIVRGRLLSRHLLGEIPDHPHYEPR